ncbi:tetratricopeptide repeat protein [Robiginitalea marina]|uniref:Tetratricopeptide repeat protein n=1 Tax=Robiginitalea marina TaxID=2954105 RepID=A0ABT1B1S2_9FLAO|nr:tetratricopeptide repeat protein [Robiginitalea marina]MCO5725558.1 tetratricopeptide repeat protein [Robiginitalea marina]
MESLEENIQRAEAYLRSSRPDLAAPLYEKSLQQASSGPLWMHLNNTLARLKELQGDPGEARERFLQTLGGAPDDREPETEHQKGIALNNLGRLSLQADPKAALEYFEKAVNTYQDLADKDPRFNPHLAHSFMARGEAYFLRKKYWFSKKDYKAALALRSGSDHALDPDMRALAHYQLGANYTDEFNAYDARTQYRKALDLYRAGLAGDPGKYRPLVAACLNNLAVVHIQLEEYEKAASYYEETLETYRELARQKPGVFRPYLASTYANLGILYADPMKRFSDAYQANAQALEIYADLAARSPERYTHYLATAYHNAGIYTLETPSWPQAKPFLSKALATRRQLEEKQPGVFGADFCASALNLLEFYQRMIEERQELQYKAAGLELLEESGAFLESLQGHPAVENMKTDFAYFRKYFEAVDEETIRTLDLLRKIRQWDEEIDSTVDLAEKEAFQARILKELQAFQKDYPENGVLRRPLALAYNNMAWLRLAQGAPGEARVLLDQASTLGVVLPALDCNLAHCDLLEGHSARARETYLAVASLKNESNKAFGEIIRDDLGRLETYGVLPGTAREVLKAMGFPAEGISPAV